MVVLVLLFPRLDFGMKLSELTDSHHHTLDAAPVVIVIGVLKFNLVDLLVFKFLLLLEHVHFLELLQHGLLFLLDVYGHVDFEGLAAGNFGHETVDFTLVD